jgi:Sec-independent protein translocase protein TatA
MSFSHMLILLAIALIVIPPDKLPEVARQIARFMNDLKRSTSGLWDDLKQEALLRPEDLLKYQPPKAPPPPTGTEGQTAATQTTTPQTDETKKQ